MLATTVNIGIPAWRATDAARMAAPVRWPFGTVAPVSHACARLGLRSRYVRLLWPMPAIRRVATTAALVSWKRCRITAAFVPMVIRVSCKHTDRHTNNKLDRPLIKFTNRFSFIIHRRSLPDTESVRQFTMPQRGHLLRSSGKQQLQLQLPARLHRSHLFRGCRRVSIESLPIWRHLCQHAWLLSVSRHRYRYGNRILSRVAYQISVKEHKKKLWMNNSKNL